ncbi:MAG: ABC transporter ATP-binding protein [Bdellovibrionales bacterium]|nr:ABC transporter ATP-binding protein [Bdellovibrionales bacterium]
MEVVCRNVSKSFRDAERVVDVLTSIDLNISSGSSVSIVGESGAGKTTLLHIIGTLESASSGDVILGGSDVTDMIKQGQDLAPFRGKNIGFIFQFHYLLPEFDAVENVAMPLLIAGGDRKAAAERAEELLISVGLKERLSHRPPELSGGEQQRVAIARALAPRPGLVLADEPTGNLDIRTGSGVHELLLELQEKEKMTLVVVTHSLELAGLMQRAVELTPGGLVEK